MRIILASGCVSLALLGWVRCVAPLPLLFPSSRTWRGRCGIYLNGIGPSTTDTD